MSDKEADDEPGPHVIALPWIIAHEIENAKLQVILAGPPGAGHEQFGLVICDIIRHVAQHFEVDEADVWHWIQREMDKPTTTLTGGRVH